jgi:hypothetical protein
MAGTLTQVLLFTDIDGRARFRERPIPLSEGTPAAALTPLMSASGLQLRQSPLGFRSDFHCTGTPQWVFILQGQMEIGLQDGSSRVFGPGEHFYSADTLTDGATFDATCHGHWSRQRGDQPLVTAFVRAAAAPDGSVAGDAAAGSA